jgi:hypothetical protein
MGAIFGMPYITLTAGTTTTGTALWLGPDGIQGWSMHVITTGTLTGSFRFYRSSDPRARPDRSAVDQAAAKWREFTSDVAAQISNPAAGTTDFEVMVSDFRSDFVRMDYVHTSGTGTVTSFFSGH